MAAVLAAPTAIWFGALFLQQRRLGTLMALTREDGLVESAQVLLLLVCAALSAFVTRFLARDGEHKWALAYAAGTALLICVAGEEINWGQRLVGLATPRWFAERNLRGETNLHNLPGVMPVAVGLLTAAIVLGVTGGLVFWRRSEHERDAWRTHLWVPQPALSPALISVAVYLGYSMMQQAGGSAVPAAASRLWEFAELVVILTGLAFLLSVLRAERALPARHRPGRIILASWTPLGVVRAEPAPVVHDDPTLATASPTSRKVPAAIVAFALVAGVAGVVLSEMTARAARTARARAAVNANAAPSPWTLATFNQSVAQLVQSDDRKSARVEISDAGNRPGDVQLAYTGIKLEGKTEYRLEFRTRATRPRTIYLAVTENHPPWGSIGLYTAQKVTPEWVQIRLGFKPSQSESNARVSFDLGGGPSVEIADLVIRRGSAGDSSSSATRPLNR